MNDMSEYNRCTLPRIKLKSSKEIVEEIAREKDREKETLEKLKLLKKRKIEKLEDVCEEIEKQNRQT